ncbi:MAG: fibronectin type III domain-containing protein [Patescibacteria group bacterium]
MTTSINISRINLLIFAAILVVFALTLAQFAFADVTSYLLPWLDGAYTQWTPKTGSTHYTMVDESSCNGTIDYNYTTTRGNRDSYAISLSSIPKYSTITQVDIKPCASKHQNGGASEMDIFYRFNGANSADAGNYSLTGTTPVDLADTSFTGLSLAKDSNSALQVGAVYSSGTKGVRLSRIAAKITYTLPAPPVAPSSLTATNQSTSTNRVLLRWIDNSNNEEGFKVERGTDGVNFNQIAATVLTSYTDTGMANGTYYYRVREYNAGGNSGYSNTASITVP